MKILTIGSDRKLFDEGSDVRQRIIEYGVLFEELHVVVFTTRFKNYNLRFKNTKIADNVWIYPTNSISRLFYIIDAYRVGKRIIKNWKLKIKNYVLSTQDPFEAGLAGWLLKRAAKIPLQLQIHTDFLSPYFAKESLLNWIRVKIAFFLIPKANCIRVVSKRIKDSLELRIKSQELRIFVLPIRIAAEDYGEYSYQHTRKNFVLLMASRFEKEKNIEMAIDAMADIKKENPALSISLAIHGEGSLKGKYNLLIKEKQADTYIVVVSAWGNMESVFFTEGDVFLLTSNYEGYGRTVIQAMMAGCPVIMTDVGVARDIIRNGENGIIIPVGDKEALKKAILDMYTNREKLITIGMRAKEDVQKYLQTKERYLQLYKQSFEQCL